MRITEKNLISLFTNAVQIAVHAAEGGQGDPDQLAAIIRQTFECQLDLFKAYEANGNKVTPESAPESSE